MSRHTYKTGIIGNCSYIAHIHQNTNIVWLCLPRFDSTFVFGGLLDEERGGEFSIRPAGDFSSSQYYIENTNVLCTDIETPEGKYRVTDFAPRFFHYERNFKPLMLVRKVEPLAGSPRIRLRCRPVCDYGQRMLDRYQGSNHIDFPGCEAPMRLTTNIPINYVLDERYFILNETRYLVFTYGTPLEAPLISTAETFLRETITYWRLWIKNSTIADYFQDYIIRSALALKIHQYEDTGAIIAASTTSLPESPGAGRNWDYRYCWLRDTFYVINALNHIGKFEELERYFGFITDVSFSDDERYQPLFSITGEKELTEEILTHLKGYEGNTPVRTGNQAYEHIQNDVYGQVLVSVLPLYTDHRFTFAERKGSAEWIAHLLDKVERTIDQKDAGIWEFRNFAYIHCYTNLFQWAGSLAAAKMAQIIGDKSLERKAMALKDRAAAHIEQCYNPELKAYTHAVGSRHYDASTLQLILMNYLKPDSERARTHLQAVEKALKAEGGLFYRYLHSDDFGKPESTFLICAFWYVEALACVGRLDEAQREFETLTSYANHLLLFSEDVDAETGSQWGNFPQAYSHVGLMNAAYRIAIKLNKPNFL